MNRSRLYPLLLMPFVVAAKAQTDCTGPQAPFSGDGDYVAANYTFHVNVNTPSLNSAQLDNLNAGLSSWANAGGITIVFDSSPPGKGVVTVSESSSISTLGQAGGMLGQGRAPANQITGGVISLNFSAKMNCAYGSCPAYNPNYPNADYQLQWLGAHEMGHILGLGDALSENQGCSVSTSSTMGGQCGTNNFGDGGSGPSASTGNPNSCDRAKVKSESSVYPPQPPLSSGGGGGGQHHPPEYAPPPDSGGIGGGGGCYSEDVWDEGTSTLTEYSNC